MQMRFEPTYEELKLLFQIMGRLRNGSFEPTYEELKLQLLEIEVII